MRERNRGVDKCFWNNWVRNEKKKNKTRGWGGQTTLVRNEWPLMECTKQWPVKAYGSFQEWRLRMIEKRKFLVLAIRGYCGPRNLGCSWEWAENDWGKRNPRIVAQGFATEWEPFLPVTLSMKPKTVDLPMNAIWMPFAAKLKGRGSRSPQSYFQSECQFCGQNMILEPKREGRNRHSDSGCCSQHYQMHCIYSSPTLYPSLIHIISNPYNETTM